MLQFNNIIYNFHESWFPTLTNMSSNEQNTLNNIETLLKDSTPSYLEAFRIYNLKLQDIVGVIINWKPSYNSNGLLVGTNSNELSPELQAIYRNLNYHFNAPTINNDLTLEYLAEQNILLLNINHTLNIELSTFYQTFTKFILNSIYREVRLTPVLLLGEKPFLFCNKSLLNTIAMPVFSDEEFETATGFIRFVQTIEYIFNIKINL